MHSEHFRRTKLAGLMGACACVLLLVLAARSGRLFGQTADTAQQPAAAAQGEQIQQNEPAAEMHASADDEDAAEGISAEDEGPSPGNFLGSTYVPSIKADEGAAGPVMAAAPPPPKPVPADAGGDRARQQINNETANLLAMVYALKAEVDKSNKDELSIAVVRKASQVEQLARKMRDEMRPVLSSKN